MTPHAIQTLLATADLIDYLFFGMIGLLALFYAGIVITDQFDRTS